MYHFIVNPASRSGKGERIWKEQIEPILKKNTVDYKSHFSKQAGDVANIAAEILEQDTMETIKLVVLGGDGTLNEVLQGITAPERVILGYIPTGSSNDFARDVKIPSSPAEALDIILRTGKPQLMDIGVVTYPDGFERRFAVSCGIGYDAAVCEQALHSNTKGLLNKLGLGKLTYLSIALQQLIHATPADAEIYLDDQPVITVKNLLFTTAMNHRYEGGGFMFCPDALDNDNQMDMCCVNNVSTGLVLRALPAAFKGNHLKFEGITPYRAHKIRIKTVSPLWVHTDGEVLPKSDEITISVLHNAIYMIKP